MTAGKKAIAKILFALISIVGKELGFDVGAIVCAINLEQVGNVLKEENSGKNFAEVHATLHEQTVLGLEEVVLHVDVLVNLRQELGGSDV